MRLRTIVATAGAVTAIAVPAVAFGDSPKHSTPGTPGDANCVGQTMAYLAQLDDPNGIGNLARIFNLSVQDVHAIVEQFCASV
jgi:hypothetical protein